MRPFLARTLALLSLSGWAGAAGCDGAASTGPEEASLLRLSLSGAAGVTSIRFEVDCAGGTSVVEIVPLEEEGLPGEVARDHGLPDLADSPFADLFVVAPEGTCDVTATALDDAGDPTIGCSPASAAVDVLPGETSEVLLVVPCEETAAGGLDVAAGVDTVPVIDVLVVSPGLSVAPGEVVTLSVAAHDADLDPLLVSWFTAASSKKGAAELVANGAEATFQASTPGSYEIVVTVSDGLAKVSASVTIEVTAG